MAIVVGTVALASCAVPVGAQDNSASAAVHQEMLAISGHVLHDNKPVVGANVWLIESQYSLGDVRRFRLGPRVTDKDGRFIFAGDLEQGRAYYVLAEHQLPAANRAGDPLPVRDRSPIEAPTYYGDARSLTTALAATLRSGERLENLDIRMETAIPFCVSGRVEVAGVPFALNLNIQDSDLARTDNSIHAGNESGEDGSFRLCGLVPGDYALFTPDNGNGIALFSIINADVQGVFLNVDTTPPELLLEVAADDGSAPGPSADASQNQSAPSTQRDNKTLVRLHREDGEVFAKTAALSFTGEFEPISSGDYAVDVTPPIGWYLKQLTFNNVGIAEGILHLPPGSTGTLRIVISQGAGTIACAVTGEDGGPIPDAAVVLIPEGAFSPGQLSLHARQLRADSHGVLEVGALAPGEYRLIALRKQLRPIPEDLEKLLSLTPTVEKVEVTKGARLYVRLKAMGLN
jgi:hypothetical protein